MFSCKFHQTTAPAFSISLQHYWYGAPPTVFGKPQMNALYLEKLTLEVPFRYIIYFPAIYFQCMFSLVYTVYCHMQPQEWRCSLKKGVLTTFVNFTGKHLCWSLFLIKLQAWHQFWRTSANDCFFAALAPLAVTYSFYLILSTFFLLITATTVNISNVCFWFKFKRLQRVKSGIPFSLKSLSSVLFSLFMFLSVVLSFFSIFVVAANKKDSFH